MPSTARSPSHRRRVLPQPRHGGRCLLRVGHPDRELVGGVEAVLTSDVVEAVGEGAPLALQQRRELGDLEQRGDAVLVAHEVRRDAVAQRLLVAERQPVHASDPLEAGQRLAVRLPVRRGQLPRAATTTPPSSRRRPRRRSAARSRRAARRPRHRTACASRAGQAPPPRSGRRRGRSRAPGRHRARRRPPSRGPSRRVPRGSGTSTVGKSGSGSACSATWCGAEKPARSSAVAADSPPTPCSGV